MIVQTPDGPVDFGDMPEDQVLQVMRQKYPATSQGAGSVSPQQSTASTPAQPAPTPALQPNVGSPEWGFGKELASSAIGGFLPRTEAATAWLKGQAPDWAKPYIAADPTLSSDYDTALKQAKAAQANYEVAHPTESIVARIGGGAVPFAVGGGLPGAIGVGAAEGASEAGNRSDFAWAPTVAGGVAGAGGAFLGNIGGELLSPVLSKGAQSVANAIYGGGAKSTAADLTNAALQRGGMTPAAAGETATAMGPGATLADTSDAARIQAAQLAAVDPEAAAIMKKNLADRANVVADRMNNAVNQVVSPDFNAEALKSNLMKATQEQGNAAYTPILNSGANVDLSGPAAAIKTFNADAAAVGAKPGSIGSALNQAGEYLGTNPGSVPITVAHTAIREIADDAAKASASGQPATASHLWDLRRQIVAQMPPEYQTAMKQYADNSAIQDAFAAGRNLAAKRVDGQPFDPDALEARLKDMSPAEQQAFQLGARKNLQDVMGNARSDAAGVKQLFANDNGYAVKKFRQVFGDAPINAIQNELDNQAAMQATNQMVNQGTTAGLTAAARKGVAAAPTGAPEEEAIGTVAGSEAGGRLEELSRIPGLRTIGGIAGFLYGRGIAPTLKEAAEESATEANKRMAENLTSGQKDVIDALSKRTGSIGPNVGSTVSSGARNVIRALAGASTSPAMGYFGW